MSKSLYDKDLALFEIILASLSAETGAKKTMQIYTDWIDDWINCRIDNLKTYLFAFKVTHL